MSKYTKLLRSLYTKYLKDNTLERIRLSADFYLQKLQQALLDLATLPNDDAHLFIDFWERYLLFKGNYELFVQSFAPNTPAYRLGIALGKCLAYIEKGIANRTAWNEYADKRCLGFTKLTRIDVWLKYLIQYIQNDCKIHKVNNPQVQAAIQYVLAPESTFPIFLSYNRQKISQYILDKTLDETTFDQDVFAYFYDFQTQIHCDKNRSYWITNFLHMPEVALLWQLNEDKESYIMQAEMDYEQAVAELEVLYQPQKCHFWLNQIFYGVPGTGKTYHSRLEALAIVEQQPLLWVETQTPEWINEHWQHYQNNGQISMLTFHQAMTYEDFIEGIKPTSHQGGIAYKLEDGLLKSITNRALEHPDLFFVLVIDEINRGNIPAIFGELITLLDTDKRKGMGNALAIKLPYSKQYLTLPPNLYCIGTMNTADRSVEALDAALRRRFYFRSFSPRPELLATDMEGVDLQQLLAALNLRIQYLLDTEHQIGHAYLMDIQSLNQLQQVFQHQIIPLLMDYFYRDMRKLRFILGDSFVDAIPIQGHFSEEDNYNLQFDSPKTIYEIAKFPLPKSAYIKLYS